MLTVNQRYELVLTICEKLRDMPLPYDAASSAAMIEAAEDIALFNGIKRRYDGRFVERGGAAPLIRLPNWLGSMDDAMSLIPERMTLSSLTHQFGSTAGRRYFATIADARTTSPVSAGYGETRPLAIASAAMSAQIHNFKKGE